MNRGHVRVLYQASILVGLLLLATLAVSAHEFPLTEWDEWRQQSSNRYPDENWLQYVTPEEAGWSSEGLAEARRYFDKIGSAAFLVVHDGAVLVAWGDNETRYMCHSMRKSLLSALYGIHVTAGTIDVNETLGELKVDDDPPLSDSEKQARIVDLLASRSGVYHPAAYETEKMKAQRPERGSHNRGDIFWYNNWDFNALCTIFERETNTGIFEEFEKRFAIPLRLQDYRVRDGYYHLEPEHSQHPAYPFRMSARDLARLGLLYLRNGKWQDQEILSEEWVRKSTASTFRESDSTASSQYAYGYLWWPVVNGPLKEFEMYSARGFGGHAIDVVPRCNLVMVHRVDTFWDLDLPLGRKKERVENSERFELLTLILKACVAAPKPTARLKPLPTTTKVGHHVVLSEQALDQFAQDYKFEGFTLTISREGGELFVSTPRIGKFKLVALAPTRFVLEDLAAPLQFELDSDGNVARIVAELAPGKQFLGRPVRGK